MLSSSLMLLDSMQLDAVKSSLILLDSIKLHAVKMLLDSMQLDAVLLDIEQELSGGAACSWGGRGGIRTRERASVFVLTVVSRGFHRKWFLCKGVYGKGFQRVFVLRGV